MRSDYGISEDVAQIHNLFSLASPGFPPSANGIIQHPDWKPRRHFWLPMYRALITKIFIMHSLCGKHGARSWVAKANKAYHTPFHVSHGKDVWIPQHDLLSSSQPHRFTSHAPLLQPGGTCLLFSCLCSHCPRCL